PSLAALILAGFALAAPAETPPAAPGTASVPVLAGLLTVTEAEPVEIEGLPRARVRPAFPPPGTLPVLGPGKPGQDGPGHRLLARLYARGLAAGNWGDLYENRDRGHSRLRLERHPQLTEVVYAGAVRRAGLDQGPAGRLLFTAPLIGNSSTALTGGPFWRPLPRLMLTAGEEASARLFQDYLAGQIHVYPEHRDHDPERGDLLPANTPYYIVSQGSSGSDRPHLEALAMILAAFRPDTKRRLVETGLLAPTVQMVYRRSQVPVRTRADYLSGIAHPSAFARERIDLARAVALANAITPGDIPP